MDFSLLIPLFLFFSQACTGIDNIAEAITLLELNNWDLVVSSLTVGFARQTSTSPRVQVQEGSYQPITHILMVSDSVL